MRSKAVTGSEDPVQPEGIWTWFMPRQGSCQANYLGDPDD